MSPHPVCSRCSTVLTWITLDGRHELVCPRGACEGHDPDLEPGTLRRATSAPTPAGFYSLAGGGSRATSTERDT